MSSAGEGWRGRRGFTLIELLVVVAIIAVLIGIAVPALSAARRTSARTRCLSNIRQLQIAQVAYAVDNEDRLIAAGDGTVQGSWIGPLEKYGAHQAVRRCPQDRSAQFREPAPGLTPPRLRNTSFGLNNYVSPTHAPFGARVVRRMTDVRRPAAVIQLAELAEKGTYAVSDHVHVQDFYVVVAPQITIGLIDQQMALGRHLGKPKTWDAVLNYSFLDGHAEALATRRVYTDPEQNRFDPAVAR